MRQERRTTKSIFYEVMSGYYSLSELTFKNHSIKRCQISYNLKRFLIFEVLRFIGAVFGAASVIQVNNKYPLYGHMLHIKENRLRKSFSSDWPIIAKASCSEKRHISDHTVICE